MTAPALLLAAALLAEGSVRADEIALSTPTSLSADTTAFADVSASSAIAASSATADGARTPLSRLEFSEEPADRIRACAELAQPPHLGPHAYMALRNAMTRDLSDRVRLAAAAAALAYAGGQTLDDIGAFLKSEPGAGARGELLAALSTAPAHAGNPDATRVIAASLADDPDPEVRLAAVAALSARGDPLALAAIGRASEKDEKAPVREAARRALGALAKKAQASAPKAPKPHPPKLDSVFGRDPCPPPWGWCRCAGAVSLKPKCLTRSECDSLQADMRANDLVCAWDGRNEN